jgi:ATP-binding cassette subfamily B protein/ATP-binding cassette subfamily C protein
LFALTLKENIAAMENKYNDKLLDYAASMAKINEKIYALPMAENTPLYRIFDDKGVEFSGGEMQRLAIARAVYKDSPIIVLDEPTSALDPRAEYEIYDSFNKISDNRTSVYISHRLSSSKFCDCIAVFDKGEITEYGSHNELMAKEGLYKELYTMQADLYRKTTEDAI